MKTKYLSAEEREHGLKHYFGYGMWNGLGFNFLGDTPITLMAIHFGASNIQLGYLASIINVAGLVLLFLPRLFVGQNLVKMFFYSWLFRGMVCVLYGALFFVQGQPAVTLIIIVYTAFCVIRTVGAAMSGPVQQMLTTPATTGEVVVKISNNFQLTRLLSQFISFLVLSVRQFTGIIGYQILMVFGIIFNTLSALEIKKIPCREVIEYRRGRNLLTMFVRTLQDRERALTLLVKWHILSISVLLGFIVPFLRKIAHFSPSQVFLYTIVGNLATILAGYILQPFADRVGSRPIITIFSVFSILTISFWAIAPPTMSHQWFFILGFATTFLQATVSLLSSRLELRVLPERDKISYVSMVNVSSAVVSLGIGLFGGQLADLGEHTLFPGLNSFGLTFGAAAILAVQNAILCFFLRDPGSWSIKETASILLSTNNLKTFLDVYQLNITEDRARRAFLLMSLGKSDTPIAIDEMQHIMRSPLSMEKEEVLKTLFVHPKRALLPDILREAAEPQAYHRVTAIFTLGAYPGEEVEQLLLALLDDPSPTIQSTAAKSLARIGNTSALARVNVLANNPVLGVSERMNYLIALSIMDQAGIYLQKLFAMAEALPGETFEQTMFALAAKMLDLEPPLADLYQDENEIPTTGLQNLLHEAKQFEPFYDEVNRLSEQYLAGRYQEIWEWCRKLLVEYTLTGRCVHLQAAIRAHDLGRLDKTNTLAVLYFTYQILQSHCLNGLPFRGI